MGMGTVFKYLVGEGMSMGFENGYGYKYRESCPPPLPDLLLGHMIKDCLNIRKKTKGTIFKSKKVGKRVMVATWSDGDSFGSESDDEETTKLCLMARENTKEIDESKDVALEYLLPFIAEYLV